MTTARNYLQEAFFYTIHKAIHFVNPAAPKSTEVLFQWLRLTYSFVGPIALYVLNQRIYPFQGLFVLALPIKIV